jgi:hypothetical protein
MWDDFYALDFNDSTVAADFFDTDPSEASRFLVLSTCHHDNRDKRILVYAAFVI